jgi:hypothetical protein
MIYKEGTKIKCRMTGEIFIIARSNNFITNYVGNGKSNGYTDTSTLALEFEILSDGKPSAPLWPSSPELKPSALDNQQGGDHYKKLAEYQPWLVAKHWSTPEEFRGFMKLTAITYLAREGDKGGDLDIRKALHTLQALIELGGLK